jgi:hypothetical protein
MFQFPELAAYGYEFTVRSRLIDAGVSPFGDPRIKAC